MIPVLYCTIYQEITFCYSDCILLCVVVTLCSDFDACALFTFASTRQQIYNIH